MITYSEYYQRMKAIQDALNKMSIPADPINRTGLNETEICLSYIGKYIEMVVHHSPLKLSAVIPVLVFIVRSNEETFDFSMYDIEEVGQHDELREEFDAEYIAYTRMSHYSFIGSSASVVSDMTECSVESLTFWAVDQARHLANYCLAHDINLLSVIQSLG